MDQQSKDAISAVNRRFEAAVKAGDFAGIGALYSERARLLPPDSAMVVGRDNIEAFWAAVATSIGLRTVRLVTLEIVGAGDTATEVGEAELGLATGPARVKYMVLWQKGGDSQWRLHADIWNAGPAG